MKYLRTLAAPLTVLLFPVVLPAVLPAETTSPASFDALLQMPLTDIRASLKGTSPVAPQGKQIDISLSGKSVKQIEAAYMAGPRDDNFQAAATLAAASALSGKPIKDVVAAYMAGPRNDNFQVAATLAAASALSDKPISQSVLLLLFK